MNPTQYLPMRAKTILNAVNAPSMPFDWSINPYRGCQHGCSFCYARTTHAYLGEAADDTFQHRIFYKDDAPAILRAQLQRMRTRGKLPSHVAIGTATDPYQQLEAKTKLTRGCLETLAEFGVGVSITTRSPLVLRDLDLLRTLPGASVNISIHTLDTRIWRTFEPSTPSPARRLECARTLTEAGIRVHAFAAPILPMLTDGESDTGALVQALANAGVRHMMSSFLRLSTPEVKSWFFSVLRTVYPEFAEAYGKLYWHSARLPDSYRRPVYARIAAQMKLHGLSEIGAMEVPKGDVAYALGSAPAAAQVVSTDGREIAHSPFPGPDSASPCQPVQLALF
ncbi:SPL family radical SAM protein [Cohnella hashimotonis]|uniref:Radical SAM protein n=1 Tax=Cohnella hashimotonis TaxID=2826895 RepID=A0ABT6TQE0_9BACL|nr:radical SAM protein [Cohnella hashimotonis]MDI4648535.1 radical SAM protein [Cohnella hashimotonis]